MSLAESAGARKEKLIALRRRKDEAAAGEPSGRRRPDFRFRNYDPTASAPRKRRGVGADADAEGDTVEKAVQGVVERAKAEDDARRAAELDLTSIQPKKPNWDLKRDLDKKLEKLEPVTAAAINILIRRRLQAEGANSNDGGAANLAAQVALVDVGDSSDEDD